MTKDQIFEIEKGSIVKMSDGRLGLFRIYPSAKQVVEGMCGIQVSGEPQERWIHHDHLAWKAKALVETA